ncbi:hypothetical protein [Amycolatopsis sp. WGS_07]|uniref:hypothetical protein n=1 Tax=Amycolatopsis sp. WGS_07 TaxID=3076764 RepID=UPI003872FF42
MLVPGWGDATSQLVQQDLSRLPGEAQWAITVVRRLNQEVPAPEREAEWLRTVDYMPGRVKMPPDVLAAVAGHIGDLAEHVAASGVPDRLPEAREPARLSDALRTIRDALRPAAPEPAADTDARRKPRTAAPEPGTAPAPAAQETTVVTAPAVADPDTAAVPAALTLSDGRQATRDDAPGSPHERAAYRLDAPGIRLRITRARDETGAAGWRWSLQRVDDAGKPAGAALKDSPPLATAAAAIAEAETALAALEAFLRTPSARRRGTAAGPFAALEFVPGWGTAAGQLRRVDLPPEAATGLPRIAVMIAERLDAPGASHLNAARWAAHGPGRQRRDGAQLRELVGHIRDLETRIAASGIDDRLAHQPDGPGLRAALRATRTELAWHAGVDPETLRPLASSAAPSRSADPRPDAQPRRTPASRPGDDPAPPRPDPVAPPAPAAPATAPEHHADRPEPEPVAALPAEQQPPVGRRGEDPAPGTPADDEEQAPAPPSDPEAGSDGYDWADQLEEEHGDFDPFAPEPADEPALARYLATEEPREDRHRTGEPGAGQPTEPGPAPEEPGPAPAEPGPQPAPPTPVRASDTTDTAAAASSAAPETAATDAEPAPAPQQIGAVEILRRRIYPVDPDADTLDPGTELAVVEPGRYPLLQHGDHTYWIMNGVRLGGDGGLDLAAPDRVTCTSRRYTPTGWQHFLAADPACQDGREGQRLRVVLAADDPATGQPSGPPASGPAESTAADSPHRTDAEARMWGDLVAKASALGVSVRTVFDQESETRWSPGDAGPPGEATVLVSGNQPPGARNVDLAARLVDIAMTRTATETAADVAIPVQRENDLAATAHAEPSPAADRVASGPAPQGFRTRLNLADLFAASGGSGRATAEPPAPAMARTGGRHARPDVEDTAGEQTPIYDQLLRSMAAYGLGDPTRPVPPEPRHGEHRARPDRVGTAPAGGRTSRPGPDFATTGRTR